MKVDQSLIKKYNVAGPRYTSYPPVPFWKNCPSSNEWISNINFQLLISPLISLYIHLPFCESLCTYCGCNTRITTNHAVEKPYIEAVLKEWDLYIKAMKIKPVIAEVHLGGGTPTFFSPENLKLLMDGLFSKASSVENVDCSFEAHPANTTKDHLKVLYDHGFRRVSFGIQDFDSHVQKLIHRKQSFEEVQEITVNAREIGFNSINYDLIYGLPSQTVDSIKDTVQKVNLLKPDRIAFYSYAHVPWIKPGQRKFTEMDLPTGEAKIGLYETSKQMLEQAGYVEIGMDHFALPDDELFLALSKGSLNRNFMGYTTSSCKMLIGLGVSSISDSWNCFVQNAKVVEEYYSKVNRNEFPFFKGHNLTATEEIIRKHILNIMCNLKTDWSKPEDQFTHLDAVIAKLENLHADGIIQLKPFELSVTALGRSFLRNVCMSFDSELIEVPPLENTFSSTV